MFLTFVLFASLGYLFYYEADSLNEFDYRYDDKCLRIEARKPEEPACEVKFTPDVDLENPKIYYRLDNFYQNHRSFQQFSYKQLRGEDDGTVSQCDPIEKNKDMLLDPDWPINYFQTVPNLTNDLTQKPNQEAWPCGFIAKFFFSDYFTTVKSVDRSFSVEIDDSDIAHDVDTEKRFIRNDDKWEDGIYWRDVVDEHFMVWYQMESLKDFTKLVGRIDGTMKAGKEYTISIYDNFAASLIDNEKHFLLTETGTFGGKNFVLAYFFGIAALLTLLILIFFIIGYFWKVQGRRIEEESYIRRLSY